MKRVVKIIFVIVGTMMVMTSCGKEKVLPDYDRGIEYLNQGDYEEAICWFGEAAKGGDALAQQKYYELCEVDNDVSPKHQALYKQASQGYVSAQDSLAKCYYYGDGVKQSYGRAVYWWRKAAKQGYAEAQYRLGCCYHDGAGIRNDFFKCKDCEQAIYWLNEAAEQGNDKAMNYLGVCYAKGDCVEKNERIAVYWYRKAAELGNEKAQRNLIARGESW